jgi:type IV pilus assembly protein PilB
MFGNLAAPIGPGLSPDALKTAVMVSQATAPRRIGDLLVDKGLIQPEQLERALSEAKASGITIGSVLIRLGYVTERALGEALAELHGLKYIDTHQLQVQPELSSLLPEDFMKRHKVVPIHLDVERKRIEVVIAHPDQLRVLDEVALLTGYRPLPRVATVSEITDLIDRFFNRQSSSDEAMEKLELDLNKKDNIYTDSITSDLEKEMAAEDAPVVQLVNSILMEAIQRNASDVHMEPQKERLLVRFRIDGILHEVKSIPKKFSAALTSRVKVASGMDIAERRRPQDGRMRLPYGSQVIDMRVNSLAVQFGEKIVIRLLRPASTAGGLEKLGMASHERKRIEKMIQAPHGIILVTGPTGSGKTTTLYACLREINSPERNITTIEDPIEYPIVGINQTQISHKAGLTFALCLRAILRQDPDVVLVGEIRDEETLEAGVHAALTGHLVFSTIHTNSAAKTISRLQEMGTPSYLISSSIVGIVAQRLVRRVCEACKTPYEATPEELDILKVRPEAGKPVLLYHGRGCQQCGGSGYKGRLGLYEMMPFTREIQELVDKKASIFSIEDMAVQQGMNTLGMDGQAKVLCGLTNVSEITRVLGPDLAG